MDITPTPELLAVMEPLRGLVGTWQGSGTGDYPTIDAFRYLEEVRFWHNGKPFLGYEQRTRHPDTGAPMHAETGYWRVIAGAGPGPGSASGHRLEVVIAHPTGIGELHEGTVDGGRITVASTQVVRTATAKSVTAVERTIELDATTLTYEVRMAAVGQPLQWHLGATLRRVD